MIFHAFHGCLEHEKTDGNTFTVDFKGRTDISEAAASDRLEDAADYGNLYKIIKREMGKRSDLLENVAGRIADAVEREMPEFTRFSIRVSKQNPPVDGPCTWSRVTVSGGGRNKGTR